MNRFFTPFVGSKYKEGVCGKKILVLGASFYCNSFDCQYFSKCTNTKTKDSSAYNALCPDYECSEKLLSDYPTIAIVEGQYRAYQIFSKFIQSFIGECGYDDTWDRLSFTDYVQFFVPTTKTEKSYLSQRDFEAFCETLKELQPDVVVSWGVAILNEIRESNKYIIDKERLPETEYYVSHMRVPGVNHTITLISSYHPASAKYWYGDMEKLMKYMKQTLES